MASVLAGGKVMKKDGSNADVSGCDIVCLYFSGSWCPPCRAFTPVLNEAYKEMKSQGKNVEMVFISSDKTQEAHDAYYGKMDFCQMQFGDAKIQALKQQFGISGIPALVVLKKDGSVVNKNGRGDVQNGGASAFDTWMA